MARSCPYLQRRGETFFFRIHVPTALRRIVGTREITKSLSTRDRRAAQTLRLLGQARQPRCINKS